MQVYIGSGFYNIENVRYVRDRLNGYGHHVTYDWTQNERADSFESLRAIGESERSAILQSDVVIILLPAGKGSHIELGIALGAGVPVVLHDSTGEMDAFESTSTFYHLPEVTRLDGTLDELVDTLSNTYTGHR